MKAPVSRAAIAALTALALVAGQRAEASVAPRWDDIQLANFAQVILTGRVIDIRAGRDPRVHAIYTYVTLDVGDLLKGAIRERRVVVKQLGGVLPTRGLAISDQATFVVGEEVLLFLAVRPRDRTLYTVALWQGKFTLETADRGRTARRHDPGTFVETHWRLDAVAALARSAPAARDPSTAIETRPVESDAAVASYTLLGPFRYDFSPAIDVQANGYPLLAGGGIPEIVTAARRWNSAGGSFAFGAGSLEGAARCYLQELFNSRVTISFNDPCGEIADNSGTAAIGGSYFDNSTTTGTTVNGQYFFRATEGFIVSNDDALTASLLRWSGCFSDVHLHEFGHVLGLGHSMDPNAIMYPMIRSSCMVAPHDLGVDDIEGFRFIYPAVTPPTAAPGNVQVVVNGRESVKVSYDAVTADAAAGASAATSYRIEFSRRPHRAPFGWVTSFSTSAVVAVPPNLGGTFYVTVVAVNSAGEGPGSSPVQFFVPYCSPPATPAGLSGKVVDGVVTVSWTAAPGAASYVLQAGSDTSAANLFNGNVGNVTTVSAPGWPPGLRAFVRVIAVNKCGPGAPSAPVLIQ